MKTSTQPLMFSLRWKEPGYAGSGRRIPPALYGLVLAAILPAETGAFAKLYDARDVGGWTVAASKDGRGCFLTRAYDRPGGTTLLFGLDVDDDNRLSILNANWSIKPKERLELNFRFSGSAFPMHFAVGIASEGKQGFVTSFGADFPSLLAASEFIHIFRGDVPVEKLSLGGSSAAVAELRRCVGIHKSGPAAGADGEEPGDRIPTDPFAREAGPK